MNPAAGDFISLIKHPVKFRLFLFSKLPSAFFAGVRVREVDEEHCEVTVPYKWFSQNPFRSTYFACLSMAAEMTTGVLGLMQLHKRKSAVSMLVVGVHSTYLKKAVNHTRFTCTDGKLFRDAVDETLATGKPVTVTARSTGRNREGEVIAEFEITWSFKRK